MDVKKKIIFIVPSMRGGGSERVISTLVNNLDRSKFDIILVLLKKEGPYLKDLPEDIEIVDLGSPRLRQAIFKIPRIIKAYKPNIVMSTLSHLNIYIALIRPLLPKNIKFIARESIVVSMNNKESSYTKLFDFLYKYFYKNIDLIIAQSEDMKNDMITNFNISSKKIIVINNPVDSNNLIKLSCSNDVLFSKEKFNLLAVGRLNQQKGYDLLFDAIQKLDIDFHLTIIGSGALEEELKQLAVFLGISEKVTFLGFQPNPYKYMAQADLMVLSSRYEGFPNVVLEANACGTPVVAFNCPGGTGEIIEDGVNGFLVECGDVGMLTEGVIKAIGFQWDTRKIVSLVRKQYSLHTIITKYEKALNDSTI